MSTGAKNRSSGPRTILLHSFQELESLGINVKKINDLNDIQEFENLIENIKQTYFQDYKTCYDDQRKEEEMDCMISFNK
jgi:hypothetical protein